MYGYFNYLVVKDFWKYIFFLRMLLRLAAILRVIFYLVTIRMLVFSRLGPFSPWVIPATTYENIQISKIWLIFCIFNQLKKNICIQIDSVDQ